MNSSLKHISVSLRPHNGRAIAQCIPCLVKVGSRRENEYRRLIARCWERTKPWKDKQMLSFRPDPIIRVKSSFTHRDLQNHSPLVAHRYSEICDTLTDL